MRSFFCLLLFLFSIAGIAQERRLEKATNYYEQGKYEKAHKLLKKVLKHKDTRSNPTALMLEAKTLLQLSEDSDFLEDEPKALYNSLKAAEKALNKSKDAAALKTKDSAYFNLASQKVLEAAATELKNQKFIQADKYYEKLFELTGDLRAKWGEAQVSLELKDTLTALSISKELSGLILERAKENRSPEVDERPFALVINSYISEKRYDTAAAISRNAFIIYPKSALVKELLLKSFLLDVTSRRPQLETLEAFAQMRPIFKDDSLFLHKENVLFLYLLNFYASAEEQQGLTDSLLVGFIEIKNDYFKEFGEKYRSKDLLFHPKKQELIFNLIRYAARMERSKLLSAMMRNYVSGSFADSSFIKQKETDRWKTTFDRFKEEGSAYLLVHALPEAEQVLKKERWFAPYKKELILNSLNKQSNFKDRTALLEFVLFATEEYPRNKEVYSKAEQVSLHLIKEYSDSAYFSYARLAIKQHDFLFPSAPKLQALKRNFVEQDFIQNYFGSRLLKEQVNGKTVSEFVWNGNELLCKEGKVPSSIQKKVEQRINYFRRAAGVPDYVRLDSNKNAACQKAALIYQVNQGKLYTTPAETWKCYSISAVEAAELSARVFGQTTVFAVTTLMADKGESNVSVGNRRWMLFPASRIMGHGSTNNTALIWTLDNQGDRDTAEYMHDFVSWPPRDFCPQMFAFDRWHFSIYADLSKAKVKVLLNGKPVNIHQEVLVKGYGMPSLVWEVKDPIQAEQDYTVVIEGVKLHGAKQTTTFKYPVKFIDPMKNYKP